MVQMNMFDFRCGINKHAAVRQAYNDTRAAHEFRARPDIHTHTGIMVTVTESGLKKVKRIRLLIKISRRRCHCCRFGVHSVIFFFAFSI